MRRGPWAEASALLWAASQDGVIRASVLVEMGVPERTVYRRCRDGGPWQLLGPAIVVLHNGEPTARQREIAALLLGGPTAMLSGLAAARHHGLRRGQDSPTVLVLVSAERHVNSRGHVVVERTTRLPEPVERDGLAVAPLLRAVCDQVRRLRRPSDIAAVLTEPVQRRLLLPARIRDELDAGCRKGTSTPRRVLRAVDHGVLSAAEFEAHEWWEAQPDLPPIEWNVPVYDLSGRYVGLADGLVRSVGFVWEIDSVEHHFATPEQVAATDAHRRAFEEVGLHVLGTRPSQRRDDPLGAREDIKRALAVAAAMPDAPVVFGVRWAA